MSYDRDPRPPIPSLWGLVLGATLAGSACLPLDIGPADFDVDQPRCTGPAFDFAGVWSITGTGLRDECDDENLNTNALDIRTRPLVFDVDGGRLSLDRQASDVSASFSVVESDVRDACVTFTTREETELGVVTIEWAAAAVQGSDSVRVEGEFAGNGPDECRMQGTFRLLVLPRD